MGGTISAHGKNRLDLKDYTSGVYKRTDFLEAIPELQEIADVEFDTFLSVSSTAINTSHWIQLSDKVTTYLVEEDFDGIVITHGTNTLEETAYLDRKSTRLNSSHVAISYAVFCLKKKIK